MGDDYEKSSLSERLRMAKQAPPASEERMNMVRKILKSQAMRAELFQLATQQSEDEHQKKLSRKTRNEIIWLMQESRNIGRGVSAEPEIYQEALARTWEWFGNNFERYQPERASFVTWFNRTLRFRIIDVQYEVQRANQLKQQPLSDEETGEVMDPINLISDARQDPELSAELSNLVEQIRIWLEQQKRPLSRKLVSGRPEANCYILLSWYLPRRDSEHEPWQVGRTFTEISNLLEIPVADIQRGFRDKCWPALRSFVESQGLY